MIEPHDVDLNLLAVFQEVYRERQISSAARRLGLSQSAVSNALARLRRVFNDELFVRTGQGFGGEFVAESGQISGLLSGLLIGLCSHVLGHAVLLASCAPDRFPAL